MALIYDDGPGIYTSDILDIPKSYNATATFFITADNNANGEVNNTAYPWSFTIQRMYSEGHQIASYTFFHRGLRSPAQRSHVKERNAPQEYFRILSHIYASALPTLYISFWLQGAGLHIINVTVISL